MGGGVVTPPFGSADGTRCLCAHHCVSVLSCFDFFSGSGKQGPKKSHAGFYTRAEAQRD